MNIQRVIAVYFSPVGTTRKLTAVLANALAESFSVPMDTIDFTLPHSREEHYDFTAEDLVVFGAPTYAGKLPNKILPFVQSGFSGNDALVVPLVTFGNRSFDNALAELSTTLKQNEFHTVGAGAFACQHVFSDVLAADRPDDADMALLAELGAAVAAKVSRAEEIPEAVEVPGSADAPYYRPLGEDGEPAVFLKAKPQTDAKKCIKCGLCASLCPMGSIDREDFSDVEGICIKCHACVRNCPQQAKYFDDPAFLSHKAMLEKTFTRRAQTQIFTK